MFVSFVTSCGDGSASQPSADVQDTALETGADIALELDAVVEAEIHRAPAPEHDGIYGFANGCYAVEGFDGSGEPLLLRASDAGAAFAFSAHDPADVSRFRMRATDLGSYLFYDSERHYLTVEEATSGGEADASTARRFGRVTSLDSDITLLDDAFRSPAEWIVEVSSRDSERFSLKHYKSGAYLSLDGLTIAEADAAVVAFFPQEGCADFPELTVDASGQVKPGTWDDGDVYGILEIHSHLTSNYGFGGGGMFHGAPYHRLGVEHALGSCEARHGPEGRRDLIGLFYDGGLSLDDLGALLPILARGESDSFNHHTAGYPDFTDWPNGWRSSTHTTTYYRWVERAYLGGLRLLVQLATGNSVLCDLVTGLGAQEALYSCNDMVSVDRSVEEMRNLERYIDAQSGGPGEGWLRVVASPADARTVIAEGKLAIVLGIEISNLFDCFLTPPEGFEACDEARVVAALDRYHELGVRVVFPVHKFDNAFAPGDGSGGVIELGNFINSGHYNSKIEDCPMGTSVFDKGGLTFPGLNKPREDYDAPAPVDMIGFKDDPVLALAPHLAELQTGPLAGDFCQSAGLTPLGEILVREMMRRGMIVDIAHLPQRAVQRVLEMHEEHDYPATSTHGHTYGGAIYGFGGMAQTGFHGCGDPNASDTMGNGLRARVQERIDHGLYPAEGLGSDHNGFAGARRPRFGDHSHCSAPQANPVTYPFRSYASDVEFTEPQLGDRAVDFNTEGMIHIGLLPELIEDVRRDGMSDEDLEPLFRSAEAYIRLWERADLRAQELSDR
jgi:microsomal dipeptidase-like Zn-dependent dipeptidase